MNSEAQFQDRLRDVIQHVISKFKFDGLTFTSIERGFKIDSREPDLTLFDKARKPFMVIETKIEAGRNRTRTLFHPLGKTAIGQAISYVVIWEKNNKGRIHYFATATPNGLAVFKTPDNVLKYVNMDKIQKRDYENVIKPGSFTMLLKNIVFYGKLELTEVFIEKLLDMIAKDYLKTEIKKAPLDWTIIEFLRSFVNTLSEKCKPIVELKSKTDEEFKKMLEEIKDKQGYMPDINNLVRMMSYILMNKLVFYKVLEQKYQLPYLINLPTSSKTEFIKTLNNYFERAIEKTGDFEPIFKTGIYDRIDFPDESDTLEFINEFLVILESINIEKMMDYLSYIYEDLIPPDERHQLGQFYTPPAICELIAKLAIKSPDDTILDPGCGSGGFLSASYKVLVKLKTGKDDIPPPKDVHEKILAQLYGVDINPFPAHLSAVNLAIKNVRSPSTGLNIIEHDFFYIEPNSRLLTPYTIRTVTGVESEREIIIPTFDVILGNPPYTRWVEIPKPTQKAIKSKLKEEIKNYGLIPHVNRGVEPGIYTYWIMHATKFLKQGGRLAMIISNLWMQTEYGIGFGQFLLDNYRIKVIIDFAFRLFTASISTCIILLEKEEDSSKRADNEVIFIYIPDIIESIDVTEILETINKKKSEKLYLKVIKQKDIPRNKKWIEVFFGMDNIFKHQLIVNLGELFEPSYGNAKYLVLASKGEIKGVRNPGASNFVYLSPSRIRDFNLEKFSYPTVSLDEAIIYPAITNAKHIAHFTFTENDWKELYNNDNECFMFICHKPRDKLPDEVLEYIRWGEPICPICHNELMRTDSFFVCKNKHQIPIEDKCITKLRGSRKGGRLACETESAKIRTNAKGFYGWYDLGGVEPAPIFAVRQKGYKTKFVLCNFPVAMYDALIAFIPKPKVSLTKEQYKALLAYLNSSFIQYYIEMTGRRSGNIIALEVKMAKEMPLLDVRNLSNEWINKLASLFDKLEAKSRHTQQNSEKERLKELKPIIYEIDRTLAELLNVNEAIIKVVEERVDMLIERRITGSKRERMDSIKGETEVKLKPPKRRKEVQPSHNSTTLDSFI